MAGCSGCRKRAATAALLPSTMVPSGAGGGFFDADGAPVAAAEMPPSVLSFWQRLEACIRENPWLAILVALVIGLYIGRSK